MANAKTTKAPAELPSPPPAISHVGVSVYRAARARIDSLTLERAVKQPRGTRAADGPGRKDGDS